MAAPIPLPQPVPLPQPQRHPIARKAARASGVFSVLGALILIGGGLAALPVLYAALKTGSTLGLILLLLSVGMTALLWAVVTVGTVVTGYIAARLDGAK